MCELKKSNVCQPNPCLNGGKCQSTEKLSGFFCLCRHGYQGELCQETIDPCRDNPCLNGGTCISSKPNYRCMCHDHFYGHSCEFSTFGFGEYSFASFRPLDATTNDISIIFATTKPNSLLIYNYRKVYWRKIRFPLCRTNKRQNPGFLGVEREQISQGLNWTNRLTLGDGTNSQLLEITGLVLLAWKIALNQEIIAKRVMQAIPDVLSRVREVLGMFI